MGHLGFLYELLLFSSSSLSQSDLVKQSGMCHSKARLSGFLSFGGVSLNGRLVFCRGAVPLFCGFEGKPK